MDYDIKKQTLNIQEAANFLGFKSTRSLQLKARNGEIPAFKAGRQWMFYLPDLVDHIRSKYSFAGKTAQVNTGDNVWHLAKRREAPTGTPDLRSAISECKNLRKQLKDQRPKNTRINADLI
jgi:hypothetical protein